MVRPLRPRDLRVTRRHQKLQRPGHARNARARPRCCGRGAARPLLAGAAPGDPAKHVAAVGPPLLGLANSSHTEKVIALALATRLMSAGRLINRHKVSHICSISDVSTDYFSDFLLFTGFQPDKHGVNVKQR